MNRKFVESFLENLVERRNVLNYIIQAYFVQSNLNKSTN